MTSKPVCPPQKTPVMSIWKLFYFFFFFFFFFFLEPHLLHMEIPRLGVQSELQLPATATATATATAMQDLSRICNLHHRSLQRWIPNPLSKARDPTHNLMVPSGIRQPLCHDGNSYQGTLEVVLFHLFF